MSKKGVSFPPNSLSDSENGLLLTSAGCKNVYSSVITDSSINNIRQEENNSRVLDIQAPASNCSRGIRNQHHSNKSNNKWGLYAVIHGTPGLLITLILNLFISISVGQAYFPTSWIFPSDIPRAIGVQMFLFSTSICQLTMTAMSDFHAAHGMMMIENIPFMHTIANVAISHQGMGKATFATVFMTFAICSILVGIVFLLLGVFKLGNVVHFFPRHVIVGCIGGIGIFLFRTGIEVSTGKAWEWTYDAFILFSSHSIAPFWIVSSIFEIILLIILKITKWTIFSPFYFMSIPPIFYLCLWVARFPLEQMHKDGWFFEVSPSAPFALMWQLMQFQYVDWLAIAELTPTILSLTLFRLVM